MDKQRRLLIGLMAAAPAMLALPASAEVGKHTFRISTGDTSSAPGPTGNRKFAELVSKASGGKMTVKTYDSAVLGNDVQMQGMLQGGTMDFALVGASTLSGMVKEFGVIDLPYSFRSGREADAVLDGPMGVKLLDKLRDHGLVGLGFWEIGFRQITNSKRPITRLEDLDGLKIRTVQSPVFLEYFNSLGANATPMPINEVYTALETHAIDAQENPPSIISSQKFYEVQKYLSLTSRKTWDRLSEEERRLITEAAEHARSFQRALAREQNVKLLAELRTEMKVNELSPDELKRLADKAKPVREKLSAAFGESFMNDWVAALEAAQAGGQ
jgi:tripartite ATP-independent transporter DctP family solute receptor